MWYDPVLSSSYENTNIGQAWTGSSTEASNSFADNYYNIWCMI